MMLLLQFRHVKHYKRRIMGPPEIIDDDVGHALQSVITNLFSCAFMFQSTKAIKAIHTHVLNALIQTFKHKQPNIIQEEAEAQLQTEQMSDNMFAFMLMHKPHKA